MKAAKLLKSNNDGIRINTNGIKNMKSIGTPTLVLLSIMITVVVMLGFATSFQLPVPPVWLLALGTAAPVLTQVVISRDNKRIIIVTLAIEMVIAVVFVVINLDGFINGNAGIYNSIVETINRNMAENHDLYVFKESKSDMYLAFIFYYSLIGILISVLVRFKRAYVVSLILIVSTMANMWFKGQAQPWFVASAIVLILAVIYVSNVRPSQTKKRVVAVWIFALVFAVISTGVILFVSEFKIESVDDFRDEVSYRLGNIYFGKSDYPEGIFKRFHEHPAADSETKLKVKMDQPMALHLKGYVGSKYTTKGWVNIDENAYGGEFDGLLDWTGSTGAYPLELTANFIYNTVDAKEMEIENVIENRVIVDNKNASQKYQYVTETLRNRKTLIAPKKDVNFVASLFTKTDKYSFTTTSIKDDNYLDYIDVDWLSKGKWNTSAQEDFVNGENNYRYFAKKAYVSIPQHEKKVLASNIPKCNANVHDAISVIRSYLKEQIKYSRKVKEYNSNVNYLEQVLLKDKRGFSPQFSSIATLMFRYYGIPARYVEGYYTSNVKKQNDIKITNRNAHAWVEVYMNGMGFIPVEVTPGFYKEDNEGGGNSMSSVEPPMGGGGSGGAAKARRQKDIKQEIKEIMTVAGIVVLVTLLIFIAFLTVRRTLLVYRRNKNLKSDNLDIRVGEATKYMEQLCKVSGYSLKEKLDEDEIELLEKIKFSKYEITENDSKQILDRMNVIKDETWKKARIYRKVKMIIWEGLR